MRALVAMIALAVPAVAAAGPEGEVVLEVLPGGQIQAQLIGAREVPRDQVRLLDARGVGVAASSVRTFREGPDSIAVAFVIAGSEIAMGNDTIEPADSPARYPGALKGIVEGFRRLDLAHTMPPGSIGTVIVYDQQIRTLAPLGPIGTLGPAVLGTQRDYYGRVGTNLVQGIEAALDALQQARATKNLLIVIGDGNDTNADTARTAFANLRKRAAREGVTVASIVYKNAVSMDSTDIVRFAPDTRLVNSGDNLANGLQTVVQAFTSRYQYAVFPGAQLEWNGKPQELTVEVGGERLDPVVVTLGVAASPSPASRRYGWWLLQIGIGLGLVGTIGLGMKWRARSRA